MYSDHCLSPFNKLNALLWRVKSLILLSFTYLTWVVLIKYPSSETAVTNLLQVRFEQYTAWWESDWNVLVQFPGSNSLVFSSGEMCPYFQTPFIVHLSHILSATNNCYWRKQKYEVYTLHEVWKSMKGSIVSFKVIIWVLFWMIGVRIL